MQFKNTLEAINIQMNELLKLVSDIGSDGKIHSIEVDLAMEKMRELYDLLYALKAENPQVSILNPQKTESTESRIIEQEFVLEEQPAHNVEEEIFIPDSVEETSLEQSVNFENEKPDIKSNELTQAQQKSRVTESGAKRYLGDTLKAEKRTINDELSQKVSTTTDLSSRLKTKPIANLSRAVGINEKFEFIQVLFGGDKSKYEQALLTLDQAQDFNEAYEYISKNFSWDLNNEYVQRLLELVRRKFIVRKNDK